MFPCSVSDCFGIVTGPLCGFKYVTGGCKMCGDVVFLFSYIELFAFYITKQ